MPIEVKMAKLSPTMESGQMVRWLVKVGDTVKEGDTLAEVQTDKAVMPMETFDEGIIALLDVKEGEDIALGQRVLVIAKKGEDPKQIADQMGKGGGGDSAKTADPKGSETAQSTSKDAKPSPTNGDGHSHGNGQQSENGNGHGSTHKPESEPLTTGGRIRSTPLARKVAAEAKVELGTIPGSGPSGRIIRSDVEAYLKNRGSAPVPDSKSGSRSTTAPGEKTRIPHTPMRKTIAKRMLESKASAPEIHVAVDIRIDKLLEVRESLNKQLAAEKIKLSVGDFITKAAALALRKHPGVNASYEPDAIVLHPEVNVGIAVALEKGLMVPVLQNADLLGLRETRTGTDAIVKATREGTLKPNQMMGGTFTISNLGMYGVKQFDAIINLPEVAILAVGAGEKRPVVEGNAIVVGTVMTVNLTADHRAVDGALAAEFLRTFKTFLEEPATMLL